MFMGLTFVKSFRTIPSEMHECGRIPSCLRSGP
jgi:hypothetical protein